MGLVSTLLIRNVPADTAAALDRLAASNGLSPEAQAVRLLIDAVDDGRSTPLAPPDSTSHSDEEAQPQRESLWDKIEAIKRKYPGGGLREGEIVEIRGPIGSVDFSGPEYGSYEDEA